VKVAVPEKRKVKRKHNYNLHTINNGFLRESVLNAVIKGDGCNSLGVRGEAAIMCSDSNRVSKLIREVSRVDIFRRSHHFEGLEKKRKKEKKKKNFIFEKFKSVFALAFANWF
jgi:hypothetical protein